VEDLILNVDALEEANQPFEADLPREFLDGILRAEPPTEFHAGGAAHLTGAATKMARKVLVRSRFLVPLIGQCRRCLTSVRLDAPVELTRTYVPEEQARPPAEHRRDDSEGSSRCSTIIAANMKRNGMKYAMIPMLTSASYAPRTDVPAWPMKTGTPERRSISRPRSASRSFSTFRFRRSAGTIASAFARSVARTSMKARAAATAASSIRAGRP